MDLYVQHSWRRLARVALVALLSFGAALFVSACGSSQVAKPAQHPRAYTDGVAAALAFLWKIDDHGVKNPSTDCFAVRGDEVAANWPSLQWLSDETGAQWWTGCESVVRSVAAHRQSGH